MEANIIGLDMGRLKCVTLVVAGFGIFATTGDVLCFPVWGSDVFIGPRAEGELHLATTH